MTATCAGRSVRPPRRSRTHRRDLSRRAASVRRGAWAAGTATDRGAPESGSHPSSSRSCSFVLPWLSCSTEHDRPTSRSPDFLIELHYYWLDGERGDRDARRGASAQLLWRIDARDADGGGRAAVRDQGHRGGDAERDSAGGRPIEHVGDPVSLRLPRWPDPVADLLPPAQSRRGSAGDAGAHARWGGG